MNDSPTEFRGPTGDPEPSSSRGRNRLWTAIVAGAVVVLVVGLVISRTPGSSDTENVTDIEATPTTVASTDPTDSTEPDRDPEQPPVELPADANAPLQTWTVGYSKIENGIPVGYSHDVAGARAAAANFSVSQGTRAAHTTKGLATLVDAWAANPESEWADSLRDDTGTKAFYGLDGKSVADDFAVRYEAINVDVDEYSADEATVRVYAMQLVEWPTGPNPLTNGSSWSVLQVRVQWVDGDWKIANSELLNGGPYPAPLGSSDTPAEVAAAMGVEP